MSIDYYGHCALPIEEAQKRIAFLRRKNPSWFGGMMELTDARSLAPFGYEIAREFGINFDEYFADELRHLESQREDGLVLLEPDEIRTTWLGRIFIRNLAMVFDPYLEKQQLAAKPLFSKTL